MPKSKPRRPKGLFVGLATVDIIYNVDEIPGRDEKISVAGQQVSAGGPATNAAMTFAALGGRAELVTAVGSHPLAAVIHDDLRWHSVRLHDAAGRRREIPPVSSIMVPHATGERSVVSANAAVFSGLLGEFEPAWLRSASIVLVDGHYMALCLAAARQARERRIPVVMDSGSWKEGMAELLPLLDIAICSDAYLPPGCRNRKDVFEFLAAQNIRQIAITCGASPIELLDHGRRGRIPIKKIRPVDTLGAGDILHGAFCYYASQPGTSFRDALAKAARVASFSCQFPGARKWMESRDQGSGTRGQRSGIRG
jgi:sugar/nucleoside kinase (ribokinase family)